MRWLTMVAGFAGLLAIVVSGAVLIALPLAIAVDGAEIGRFHFTTMTYAATDYEYRPVTLRFRRAP